MRGRGEGGKKGTRAWSGEVEEHGGVGGARPTRIKRVLRAAGQKRESGGACGRTRFHVRSPSTQHLDASLRHPSLQNSPASPQEWNPGPPRQAPPHDPLPLVSLAQVSSHAGSLTQPSLSPNTSRSAHSAPPHPPPRYRWGQRRWPPAAPPPALSCPDGPWARQPQWQLHRGRYRRGVLSAYQREAHPAVPNQRREACPPSPPRRALLPPPLPRPK